MRVTTLLVALFVWLPGLAAADKSAEQSPELKVLAQGAGTWNIAVVYKPGMSSIEVDHFTETRTVEWILLENVKQRWPVATDGWVLPKDPHQFYAEGDQHDIHVIVGTNRDEGTLGT